MAEAKVTLRVRMRVRVRARVRVRVRLKVEVQLRVEVQGVNALRALEVTAASLKSLRGGPRPPNATQQRVETLRAQLAKWKETPRKLKLAEPPYERPAPARGFSLRGRLRLPQ